MEPQASLEALEARPRVPVERLSLLVERPREPRQPVGLSQLRVDCQRHPRQVVRSRLLAVELGQLESVEPSRLPVESVEHLERVMVGQSGLSVERVEQPGQAWVVSRP